MKFLQNALTVLNSIDRAVADITKPVRQGAVEQVGVRLLPPLTTPTEILEEAMDILETSIEAAIGKTVAAA